MIGLAGGYLVLGHYPWAPRTPVGVVERLSTWDLVSGWAALMSEERLAWAERLVQDQRPLGPNAVGITDLRIWGTDDPLLPWRLDEAHQRGWGAEATERARQFRRMNYRLVERD